MTLFIKPGYIKLFKRFRGKDNGDSNGCIVCNYIGRLLVFD